MICVTDHGAYLLAWSRLSAAKMGYTGYSGEIPSWEMGYTRDKDVDVPNLGALLKGRAPGPVSTLF